MESSLPMEDPIMKLVEIVNTQLKQGKSENDIIELLISSGLEEAKARNVVETVKSSKTSHFSRVIRFIVFTLTILSSLTFALYNAFGEFEFVAQTKLLTLVFFLCFILFGIMAGIKGKITVYIRLLNSGIWLSSSFMLMVAMFLHPGWDSKWSGTGGGWRGQLVSLAGNTIYNVGSKGIAYILVVLSFGILMLFWAEFHRLKTQNYAAI
jgi:hypothetical protein